MPVSYPPATSGIQRYQGAVALIDILGFKGIWKRHSSESVIRKLEWIYERQDGLDKALRTLLLTALEEGEESEHRGLLAARMALISDTIIIICGVAESPSEPIANERRSRTLLAVCSACRAVRSLLFATAFGGPRMTVRGGIGVGEFYASKTAPVFVGTAVDSAAETEKEPVGPFILLSRDAAELYQSASGSLDEVAQVDIRLKTHPKTDGQCVEPSNIERRLLVLPHDNIRRADARKEYRGVLPDDVCHIHIRDALDDFYEKFDATCV